MQKMEDHIRTESQKLRIRLDTFLSGQAFDTGIGFVIVLNAITVGYQSDLAAKGLPIPRPELVRCGDCRHFQSDPIGDGGIGQCKAGLEAGPGVLPMYPFTTRRCERWLP